MNLLHPCLAVDCNIPVQTQVRHPHLLWVVLRKATSCPKDDISQSFSLFSVSFSAHTGQCSLHLTGSSSNILFGAEHTSVTYSQHFEQQWVCIFFAFTTIPQKEKLLWLRLKAILHRPFSILLIECFPHSWTDVSALKSLETVLVVWYVERPSTDVIKYYSDHTRRLKSTAKCLLWGRRWGMGDRMSKTKWR